MDVSCWCLSPNDLIIKTNARQDWANKLQRERESCSRQRRAKESKSDGWERVPLNLYTNSYLYPYNYIYIYNIAKTLGFFVYACRMMMMAEVVGDDDLRWWWQEIKNYIYAFIYLKLYFGSKPLKILIP